MLLEKIKTSQKLEQILLNFIDVLRINILLVDAQGNIILAPNTSGYGWNLSSRFGTLSHLGTPKFLLKFKKEDHYLLSIDPFGFHTFGIPVGIYDNQAIGYLIVGPVVLNRKLNMDQYELMMSKLDIQVPDFESSLNEMRVTSFNSLKSILDLLFDLSHYALKIGYEEKPLPAPVLPPNKDHFIYTTLLDLAMMLTEADSGSIMLFNKSTKELKIQVYKGPHSTNLDHVTIKLGEGIAGLAAQEKKPFLIRGNETTTSNNRIHHLLKKPELKCSMVLPILRAEGEVVGVMNISTKQGSSRLAMHSEQMLESLTRITADAVGQSF